MTTPEQLLADASWRRRHSIYTLWALLFGFGFISLLYSGIRAKKNNWIAWGVLYGVIVMAALAIGGSLSPKDPDEPAPLVVNVVYTAWIIVWIISAIHVFRERKEWLRWKAAAEGQPRWYEAPLSPSTTSTRAADLSTIDLSDPTSDYLAGPPPAATPAPPPKPPPPPPTAPRPTTNRNLPPPPKAPPPRVAERTAPEPTTPAEDAGDLVDLNTATVDAIAAVPGVGTATAHRIIEERRRRSGFGSVDEAALAVKAQPHVRARLQKLAFVSERAQAQRRRTSGRIVDI